MEKKNIDRCQAAIAASMKKNFNCQIIYADSLHQLQGFNEFIQKYEDLQLEFLSRQRSWKEHCEHAECNLINSGCRKVPCAN